MSKKERTSIIRHWILGTVAVLVIALALCITVMAAQDARINVLEQEIAGFTGEEMK